MELSREHTHRPVGGALPNVSPPRARGIGNGIAWMGMTFLLYVGLTYLVVHNTILSADTNVELWVHSFRNKLFDTVFPFFSNIGGGPIHSFLAVIVFGILLWGRHIRWAWTFAVAMIGSTVLSQSLDLVFHRARPRLWPMGPSLPTFSFPSGHTATSMCFAGMLIWFGFKLIQTRWGRLLWTATVIATLIIVGISRIYMGAHWPTDVLAGYICGAFWLALVLSCALLYDRWRGPETLKPHRQVRA